MEFFKIKRDIPFMRHALIFNVISALTFVAAVFFLLHRGLHYSVEFTGGTVMELRYPHAADQENIRRNLEKLGYEQPEVSSFGTAQDVMLRLPILKGQAAANSSTAVFNALCADDGGTTRAVTKKESRMDMTMISVSANNPLKFFPNADSALTQMLTNSMAGYMPPVQAMRGMAPTVSAICTGERLLSGRSGKPRPRSNACSTSLSPAEGWTAGGDVRGCEASTLFGAGCGEDGITVGSSNAGTYAGGGGADAGWGGAEDGIGIGIGSGSGIGDSKSASGS